MKHFHSFVHSKDLRRMIFSWSYQSTVSLKNNTQLKTRRINKLKAFRLWYTYFMMMQKWEGYCRYHINVSFQSTILKCYHSTNFQSFQYHFERWEALFISLLMSMIKFERYCLINIYWTMPSGLFLTIKCPSLPHYQIWKTEFCCFYRNHHNFIWLLLFCVQKRV